MLKKIETVLIGTSLTKASDEVVRAGVKVARAANARVVLAHACSPNVAYAGVPYVPELPEVVEAQMEILRRKVERQAHLLGAGSGESGDPMVDYGPAHQMLIETARKTKADLIVVGAAEAPRLARLFGSTADRVVRKAACPVLVVRRELPMPPARVLFPIDLSLLSAEAFRKGLEILGLLARDQHPAATLPEVEALYVITELDRHLFATEETPVMARKYIREELGSFIVRHAADSAFRIVPHAVTGHVEEEILRRMRQWEPDLVVIGTHGRSGFERFLLGSVAARIAQDGGANVLIVPPEAAREHAGAVSATIHNEVMVG